MAVDPVTIIVGALVAGAAAGFKKTATQAISDAYAGLKRWISDKYEVSVASLEKKPESEAQQDAIRESLEMAQAGSDSELVALANRLIDAVKHDDPDTAKAVGFVLERIEARNVEVEGVEAGVGSTGFEARDIKASGDVKIKDIKAGIEGDSHRP